MAEREDRHAQGGGAAPRTGPPGKKPYVAPKLIEYGSTSKLSAAKPGPIADGANVAMKTCL